MIVSIIGEPWVFRLPGIFGLIAFVILVVVGEISVHSFIIHIHIHVHIGRFFEILFDWKRSFRDVFLLVMILVVLEVVHFMTGIERRVLLIWVGNLASLGVSSSAHVLGVEKLRFKWLTDHRILSMTSTEGVLVFGFLFDLVRIEIAVAWWWSFGLLVSHSNLFVAEITLSSLGGLEFLVLRVRTDVWFR